MSTDMYFSKSLRGILHKSKLEKSGRGEVCYKASCPSIIQHNKVIIRSKDEFCVCKYPRDTYW